MRIGKIVGLAALTSAPLFAESFAEAIRNGDWGGDAYIYNRYADCYNKNGACNYYNPNDDGSGYGQGSFNLYYSSAPLNGFGFSVGERFNYLIWQRSKRDFSRNQNAELLLHTANVGYTSEHFDAIVGRQQIALEWVSDYHQAAAGIVKPMSGLALFLGYTQKKAVADGDDWLVKFAEVNEDKGVYVADLKFTGLEGLTLNPFYYNAPNLASWYGGRIDYDAKFDDASFGASALYTASDEEEGGDGAFSLGELRAGFGGLNVRLGYAKADKDGTGSITSIGDCADPFWNGDIFYKPDVRTLYARGVYIYDAWRFSALFGDGEGDGLPKVQELNLNVGYTFKDAFDNFSDSLRLSLVFVNVSVDNHTSSLRDHSKYASYIVYNFSGE